MHEAQMIKPTDTFHVMAQKIFEYYDVGCSCTVTGFVEMPDDTLKPKGELVLEEIERLDKSVNFTFNGVTKGNGLRRRRVKPDNTIGDYLRNKTFQWEKRTIDNQVRISIWRIQ